MSLDSLLKGVNSIAIVCNQWGDSGKGKFVDNFASEWADVIIRSTGGNNAGHTKVINNLIHISHLLPSGILHDNRGKINIMNHDMVIDLAELCEEMDTLDKNKYTYNNLMISKDAGVVLPYHVRKDKAKYKSQKGGGIGSTGRGIGPAYEDMIARTGIKISDLYNKDILADKISKKLIEQEGVVRYTAVQKLLGDQIDYGEFKNVISLLHQFDNEEDITKLWNSKKELTEFLRIKATERIIVKKETEELIAYLTPYAERIKPFVRNTRAEVEKLRRDGKKILLEGAQGLLLSIKHGTYPYVTSSDCSFNGTASGAGIFAGYIDLVIGIIKFPFMTRVGGGPFPTELIGYASYYEDDAIIVHTELKKYGIPFNVADNKVKYDHQHPTIIRMINSADPWHKTIGIRLAAEEYGATTGRPRRIGYTDAIAAKYAVGLNGPIFALTKWDAMADADEFNICYGYKIDGKKVDDFDTDAGFLNEAEPIYKRYAKCDIRGIRDFNRLPLVALKAIEDFERYTGGHVAIISNSPERDAMIVR